MPILAGSIRLWLQPYIMAAAKVNYGATRFLNEMRELGFAYRKTEYLFDYRSYHASFAQADRLKFVRRDYKPTPALFTEHRVMMQKSFRYNTKTTFYDDAGGVYSTRNSYVASDQQLTRGEVEAIVEDRLADYAEDSAEGTVKATLSEAWHREGDAWD